MTVLVCFSRKKVWYIKSIDYAPRADSGQNQDFVEDISDFQLKCLEIGTNQCQSSQKRLRRPFPALYPNTKQYLTSCDFLIIQKIANALQIKKTELFRVQTTGSAGFYTTSIYGSRSSADSTGYLFILFFFFQSSFFLWIKLGLFLKFSFAFILFSLITHISFSLLENGSRRTVAPNICRQAVSYYY